jgi:ketosteroid isomerase-like protein
MKMKNLILLFGFITICHFGFSQSKTEKEIQLKVEQLKLAMIDADSLMLDRLTSDQLSYGHSGGTIEGKDAFIKKISSGKSDFVTMDISEQSILVSGNVAIVRFKMDAVTNDKGTPGEVHLKILLVWKKEHRKWKLLARQAVKIV